MKIKAEFVDFEYQALACLFKYLATKEEPNEFVQREARLSEVRDALRKAYLKNTGAHGGSDKLHSVPPHLLVDEQATILDAIKYARTEYKKRSRS